MLNNAPLSETSSGNDMKNNNTWIKVAKKTVKDGQRWKANMQGQQEKDLWTMCYAEKTTTRPNPTSPIPERGEIRRRRSGQHHIVQVKIEVLLTKLKETFIVESRKQ